MRVTDQSPEQEKISAALLEAQRGIEAVGKDAQNSYHNYDYVSAEAMIAACRRAMIGAGLVFSHIGWEHQEFAGQHAPKEPIGKVTGLYRVECQGQYRDYVASTLVIPEKGRPADKAQFGALTAQLGYVLRGLLNLPRVDADQIDARNDRDYAPGYQHAAPEAPTVEAQPNGPNGVGAEEFYAEISAEIERRFAAGDSGADWRSIPSHAQGLGLPPHFLEVLKKRWIECDRAMKGAAA